MSHFSRILLAALLLLPFACNKGHDSGGGSGNGSGETPHKRIAVIPKGTTHIFWKSVEAGAQKAGAETHLEILWKGPLKESDRAQQIQLVQQFVSEGVDAIVLAPLDFKALVHPVQAAAAKKIPVIIIDSALDAEVGKDYQSFVATDNQSAGSQGGAKLAELIEGKGKVVLLRYAVGSASTEAREKGFLQALTPHKGIQVTVDNQYAGATAGEAKTAALNLMDQIKQADAIFCPNESTTMGMLLALRQEGLAGKVKFVGFDASPPLVAALRSGEIDALVVQDPYKMGYQGVLTAAAVLKGNQVAPLIDTGAVVVTKANMDQPEIKKLLP